MSCGVELCPAGTVGNVTMRGGSCSAGQIRMLGTYSDVLRATPGAMNGYGSMRGGACSCMNKTLGTIKGGYRATQRNRKYLKKYKSGKSIGFTMTASLKAKGLIPRANGTYKISKKYQTRG